MSGTRKMLVFGVGLITIFALVAGDSVAQRGRGGGGRGAPGGGGGRSASHRSPSASRGGGSGPAMSRQGSSRPQANRSPGASANRSAGNLQGGAGRTSNAAANRGANADRSREASRGPAAGTKEYKRPGSGAAKPDRPSGQRPSAGNERPQRDRPQRGEADRPRPGGGATSEQLSDFLGTSPSQRPGSGDRRPGGNERPGEADRERPSVGDRERPDVGDRNQIGDRERGDLGDRQIGSRDVNIGEVNVGNRVNYADNRQGWIDNRHTAGNRVRANAGDRYVAAYRSDNFRRGRVGGYGYYAGWVDRGRYYAWRAPTAAALGVFFGASLANAQPVYYGYGSGGNVYYENNTVYVDGQAAGTPEQYAQQALDYVEAAPPAEEVSDDDWLPLGVFVLTREDVADSHTMLELAINKQGVLAGTYYNESTDVSRPLKGTMDQESQRAVVGFGDGQNSDVALETGIFNLTQEEAPGLLHHGTEQSTPVLLVRLPEPSDDSTN